MKPEIDAGVIALLRVMERETAQEEMLGALGKLLDIDDAYVRQESFVAGTDCAMSRFSDSNEYISVVDSIQHDQTGSYDADIIDKVDIYKPISVSCKVYMSGIKFLKNICCLFDLQEAI